MTAPHIREKLKTADPRDAEDDAPPVRQVIYASAAIDRVGEPQLERLLRASRQRNVDRGITGMLLFENGSFLQVLEGPEEVVEGLISAIQNDPRHTDMVVLHRSDVPEREFGAFSMAWVRPRTLQEDQPLPGWDAFLHGGLRRGRRQDTTLAIKLLHAFRDEGRYHR